MALLFVLFVFHPLQSHIAYRHSSTNAYLSITATLTFYQEKAGRYKKDQADNTLYYHASICFTSRPTNYSVLSAMSGSCRHTSIYKNYLKIVVKATVYEIRNSQEPFHQQCLLSRYALPFIDNSVGRARHSW